MTSELAELCERLLDSEGLQTSDRTLIMEKLAAIPDTVPYLLARIQQVISTHPREALEIAEIAETIAAGQNDAHSLVMVARAVAQSHRILGEHQAALTAFDVAAQRAMEIGDPLLASQIQIGRIDSLGWLGQFEEAIRCADGLIQTFRAAGHEADIAKILVNLGNINHRRDLYTDALGCYEEASTILERCGDLLGKARSDFNRANILLEMYRVGEAFALFHELRAFYSENGMATAIAMADSNIGTLHHRSGQYAAALQAHQQARKEFVRFQQELQTAHCDSEMADSYRLLNLRAEALDAYERAIIIFRKHGATYDHGRTELGRAAVLASGGERIPAGEALQEAEAIFDSRRTPVHWAHTRLLRACWYLEGGDIDAAEKVAEEACRVYHRFGLRPQVAEARFILAEVAFRRGEDATRKMNAVRLMARKHALGWLECRTEEALGRYYAQQNRQSLALKHFSAAVDALEAARTLVVGEDLHTAFLQDKLSIYEEIVAFLLSPNANDPALALEYVERSKSRLLLEKVQAAINGAPTPSGQRSYPDSIQPVIQSGNQAGAQTEGIQTEGIQTEGSTRANTNDVDSSEEETYTTSANHTRLSELRAQLNQLYNQMQPRDDEQSSRLVATSVDCTAALIATEMAYRDALRMVELEAETGISTISQVATTAQLQSWIAPDETLIEFYIVHGQIGAFLLTRDRIEAFRALASPLEIEQLARRVRYHLHRASSIHTYVTNHMDQLLSGIQKPLARLYDMLLRPLSGMISTERVTIVPHGILHGLPFHAFFDQETEQYALDRWEFAYAPSATLRYAGHLRRGASSLSPERDRKPTALIMGVPDVGLEKVTEEVEEIATILPDSQLFSGDNATLEAFYANAPGKRLIHLATHALFRADTPLFSGLRFANGWLLARDLYGLRLQSELVILSACRTGQALVESGDEMFGLLRGFLAAGARSIAVSLWPAEDNATSILMRRFHPLLSAGMSGSAALRQAQKDVRQSHPHPYQWAPFTLFGER